MWLLLAVTVVTSRFATDPGSDTHGFGLIFGTLLPMPFGLVYAVTLPLAFAPAVRALGHRLVTGVLIVGTVSLFVLWFSVRGLR